jgi:hypothetical protein
MSWLREEAREESKRENANATANPRALDRLCALRRETPYLVAPVYGICLVIKAPPLEWGNWVIRRVAGQQRAKRITTPIPQFLARATSGQPPCFNLSLSLLPQPLSRLRKLDWTGLDWTGLVCSEPDATGQERAVGCAGEAFQHGHGHAWAYSCLPARRFARGDVEVLL